MSEIAATTVHEAYAFACMRCGFGWEQGYEIEHHVDGSGHPFVVYKVDGERVPSPLSTPRCANCGGSVVRIMREGQISTVQRLLQPQPKRPKQRKPGRDEAAGADAAPSAETAAVPVAAGAGHHWHLSDLLHPFHRR
ncbi:hypothetical protein [uncultured Streptomyces sp.]|uniref:hypothetical protein n=1 Tax=uncultured Streptomyces sp. TaxID=174707 RepID=UPI00261BF4BF|nr:hypothetical protein [uncultured Streptomyces sp.]